MRIVVDTNIIFSALLKPESSINNMLLVPKAKVSFFAPSYLLKELNRYRPKLQKISKLSLERLEEASARTINRVYLVEEELIPPSAWEQAFALTKDVDENDTPFVALSIALNAFLWTGDKKLMQGLHKKGWDRAIDTVALKGLLES